MHLIVMKAFSLFTSRSKQEEDKAFEK